MNYKILTIDQGTTSSRSITYDINGGTIESSQYEYPLIYPEDGWVEIDPQVLMDSVIKSLNDIDKDEQEEADVADMLGDLSIDDLGSPAYPAAGMYSLVRRIRICKQKSIKPFTQTMNL